MLTGLREAVRLIHHFQGDTFVPVPIKVTHQGENKREEGRWKGGVKRVFGCCRSSGDVDCCLLVSMAGVYRRRL